MAITARRIAVVVALILFSALAVHLGAGRGPGARPPLDRGPDLARARGAGAAPDAPAGPDATKGAGAGASAPRPESGGAATEAGRRVHPGAVRVTVTSGETGRPVPGARVVVHADGEEVGTGSADAEGLVSLDGIPGGFVAIVVSAPGHVLQVIDVVSEEGSRIEMELALEAGRVLEGRVVDPAGRPIPDASVTALPDESGEARVLLGTGPAMERTDSGADGRFVLRAAPSSTPIALLVRARGYALGRVPISPAEVAAGEAVEAVLVPGGSVRGSVVGGDGTPVAGATVHLLRGGVEPGDPSTLRVDVLRGGFPSEGIAVTGADGSYRIDGLAFGTTYTVRAAAPGRGRSDPVQVHVSEEASVATRDLAFPIAGSLVVTVADGAGGGLEEIEADLRGPAGPVALLAEGEGSFRAAAIPVGEYTVLATARERMSHRRRVRVRPGETEEVRIVLGRGETLSGLVVDTGGRPVPGANLMISRADQTSAAVDAPFAEAETDGEGRFFVSDLARGSYVVTLFAPFHEGPVSRRLEVPAGDVRFELRRDGSTTVSLRVQGAPPPEQVYVMVRTRDGRSAVGRMLPWPEGPVDLGSAEAGECELVVVASGFGRAVLPFTVGPGGAVDLEEVVLRPAVGVAGTVSDPQGGPAGGVQVEAGERWMPDHEVTMTDAAGAFRLRAVSDGPARLIVRAPDLPPQVFTVRTGPDVPSPRLRLRAGARLRGRVLDSAGSAWPDARILLTRLDEGPESALAAAVADVEGRFDVVLPEGRWRLTLVRVDGGAPVEREIVLSPGTSQETELRVGD